MALAFESSATVLARHALWSAFDLHQSIAKDAIANPHATRAMVTRTFDLQESDRSREELVLLIAMARNFARGQTYTILAKLSAKDLLCDRFSANPWPRINTDENFLRRKRIAAKLMAGLSSEDITDKRTRHIREETKPFR